MLVTRETAAATRRRGIEIAGEFGLGPKPFPMGDAGSARLMVAVPLHVVGRVGERLSASVGAVSPVQRVGRLQTVPSDSHQATAFLSVVARHLREAAPAETGNVNRRRARLLGYVEGRLADVERQGVAHAAGAARVGPGRGVGAWSGSYGGGTRP